MLLDDLANLGGNFTTRAGRATVRVATMRPHDLLRFFFLNGLAVGLGAVVASSCVEVNYPTVAFRCNPRQNESCPETHFCCSDDPAAEGGALPAYFPGISNSATPLFSAHNNGLSTSGMCVRLEDVPCGSGLAESVMDPATGRMDCDESQPNCPVPCNPTWSRAEIDSVCGAMRTCCQTVQLEPEDCILDGGSYRPVSGHDVPEFTRWQPGDHSTHQDPNGRSCAIIANSDDLRNPAFRSCVNQLTVANQRGFCMPSCPGQPTGPDACELRNQGGGDPS